jgi:hypothetical protein
MFEAPQKRPFGANGDFQNDVRLISTPADASIPLVFNPAKPKKSAKPRNSAHQSPIYILTPDKKVAYPAKTKYCSPR